MITVAVVARAMCFGKFEKPAFAVSFEAPFD